MIEEITPTIPTVNQTTPMPPAEVKKINLWFIIIPLAFIIIISAISSYFLLNQQQELLKNIPPAEQGLVLPSVSPTPTPTPTITPSDNVSDIEKDLSGTTFETENFSDLNADLQAL